MSVDNSKVAKKRWLIAQAEERRDLSKDALVRKNLILRRYTWSRLLDVLGPHLAIGKASKVLDIGGGPTPVFLGLREGEKWAVDPNHDFMYKVHPFMKEVPEYKDVNFVSLPVEEWKANEQFDLIFGINWLDHVADIESVVKRIDDLLKASGTLVLIVDCYADELARKVITFFDVDIAHPHHFLAGDILTLFSQYTLVKRDDKIHVVFSENPFPEDEPVKPEGIGSLAGRYWQHVREQKGGPFFAPKYFLCYSLALILARLRKKEEPIYPLKKLRLFIFRKS